MARERLVAVSYPVDDDFTAINTDVLGDEASLVFLSQLPEAERAEVLQRAEVLIGWQLRRELPPGALQRAAGLRFIELLSAGVDGVDFATIPEHAVLAGNVGAYAEPIAEHVLAMTLSLAKRLPQQHAALASGRFDQGTLNRTLNGAVCAILGFGGIGQRTASLMRAFGARIYAVNSTGRTTEPVEFAGTLADLDQVLAAADVVVIALPLAAATRGLLGQRELGLMKPGAILINVARGAIIDQEALYEHLRANPEFSAGIDAWWHEPGTDGTFRVDFPFFELPNLLGSPHNSGFVPGVLQVAAQRAAENVRRYLRGEAAAGVVRREDYSAVGG